MVAGQPEAERPEAVDSSSKERAGKRADPPPTQHKTAQSCQANIYNHKVLERVEPFEMRLIQTDSKGEINACGCSELS